MDDSLLTSGLWALVQMIFVLIAVIALAYLVLHKGVGFFVKKSQTHKLIQIKERIAIDQKRSLYIIEVENRRFLMSGSEHGVSLVCELTDSLQVQSTEKIFLSSLNQGASHLYDKAPMHSHPNLQADS